MPVSLDEDSQKRHRAKRLAPGCCHTANYDPSNSKRHKLCANGELNETELVCPPIATLPIGQFHKFKGFKECPVNWFQFPSLFFNLTTASVGLRHVVTLTLKHSVELQKMWLVSPIEGVKVADAGRGRGPVESNAWGEVNRVFLSLDSLHLSSLRGYPSRCI